MSHKFPFAFTLLLCCAVWLGGCRRGGESGGGKGVTVQDATGQMVTVSDTSRIISIGTATTETIYALGAGPRLVGVDNASAEYLPQAAALPKVGPRTTLNAEAILSLKPTLILIPMDAGPARELDQLKRSGVPIIQLNTNYNYRGVEAKIDLIARTLGQEARGAELKNSLEQELREAHNLMERALGTPKVLFVERAPDLPNARMAGTGTPVDEMIKMASGQNAVRGFEGLKELSDEAVASAAPDIILITEKSLERSGGLDGVVKFPGVSQTPAGKSRRIVTVGELYAEGFGPTVGKAVRELVIKLHPEVSGEQKESAASNFNPSRPSLFPFFASTC